MSMRRANLSALCGLLFIAGAVLADDAIPWAGDYRQAVELAARERKLVLLHFWSDDCPPCRRVEAGVFPKPEVAAAVAAAYVPVKVHVDKAPELARRYQVTRWPTDVIVTPSGLEVYRTVSPQDPARYVAMLNETAARSGSGLAHRESPAQGAKGVGPTQPAGYQQPQRSATPPADQSSEFQPPMIEQGTPAKMQPATPAEPQQGQYGGSPQTNPYVGQSQPPKGSASLYESEFTPAAGGASSPGPEKTALAPGTTLNPRPADDFKPNANANPAKPRESAPPAVAPNPPRGAAPNASPGLPPLGMEGYCVITLGEKAAWTKGDKRFGAIHRGRLYLFANHEAQKKFLADPDRFSPALSGYDPVRFAETGQLVDGKRAHGIRLESNNQVYLFADEASLQKFQAAPRPFIDAVYQAMLKSDSQPKYR